jgi:hypothetical protein
MLIMAKSLVDNTIMTRYKKHRELVSPSYITGWVSEDPFALHHRTREMLLS